MNYRVLALMAAASILVSCASAPTSTLSHRPARPPVNQPSADWENTGVSPNGNILNELDKLSIKREGTLVTFRDRKTIFNLKKENFLSTPRHKVSINTGRWTATRAPSGSRPWCYLTRMVARSPASLTMTGR
ncbi:hypothetical protein [Paludibacterium denitrificans]|uniref:hypothetical protein n=1 Tax=Paludibacterium denitrificans TaxID=2675226 RepID=UPI001E56F767|nr:hypothetical protein [Paludibacterium denitrificans]